VIGTYRHLPVFRRGLSAVERAVVEHGQECDLREYMRFSKSTSFTGRGALPPEWTSRGFHQMGPLGQVFHPAWYDRWPLIMYSK
jgi:hypothetical protein